MALALGLAAWLYVRKINSADVPKGITRLLFALRFISTTLILLFLLNLFLKRLQNETENPVILLAVDNSASMLAAGDSAFLKGGFLEQLETFKRNIGEKYAVKTLLFGDNTRQSSQKPDFSEKETDIDNLVKDVENNYSGQNVGALVIVSDGIYNRGANPVYTAGKPGFPFYTVACGDTTENRDALIQKISHNQVAYLGNNFPVEVMVSAKKLSGKELQVSLLQNGALKGEQKIKAASENFSGSCSFTLSATSPGTVRYTVKVSAVEGEKNLDNNSQSFVIEVIDNRDKILLLAAGPHPDVSAIRESLGGLSNYELDYSLYEGFSKPLKAYSLVILHGYSGGQLNLLNECRNNNIPFWIVNPQTADNLPGIKITSSMNRFNDSEPYIDESFGLFSITGQLKQFTASLPAVKTFFGNYAVSNAANSLISQRIGSVESGNPILFFSEQNGLKFGLFIGDGLWRWKLRDFVEHRNHDLFNELVGKSVQYLVVKSDKSFFRITPPRIVNENENVEFGAEVYNKSYEAITVPDVSLVLSNAANKKFNYTFSKTGSAYRLNAGRLSPGDYSYEASVKVDGQLFVKKGSFTVKEIFAEKVNTVANHRLLQQLSNRTNGKLFYPTQLESLQKELLANEAIKPVTYSQSSVSPLIELKWLFALIAVLMAVEWFIRKRYFQI